MHISLVCAAASAALSAWLMGWPREGGYQLTWLVMAVLCAVGTRQFMKETDRRAKWCFGVLGALFMLCMGLGWRLESADRTGFARRHPQLTVEPATLEDIMLFVGKGEDA